MTDLSSRVLAESGFSLYSMRMVKQWKTPDRRVFQAGECVTFRLEGVPEGARAFVRTTLGRADLLRRGIVAHVEADEPVGVLAWHDLEMHPADGGFELTVPLLDPGCFEAKCCCRTGDVIQWPEGDNFLLKV